MTGDEGELLVVATPIGNLGDVTARALETLAGVDAVLAEDTRRTRRLLTHFGIHRPLLTLNEHNEHRQSPALIARLRAGQRLALVSDAGTPLLSDPGFHLVRAAARAGLRVTPVPGPSAVLAALSVAGLPTDRFVFEGFLPAARAERRRRLEALAGETRTLVLFEAPHRIADSLADMAERLGVERRACLARELTKRHETLLRAPLGELAREVAADERQRLGESVVVVEGAAPAAGAGQAESAELARVLAVLRAELPLKQAVSLASRLTGVARNRVYRLALENDAGGA